MIGAIAGLGVGSVAWADSPPAERGVASGASAARRSSEERVDAGDARHPSEARPAQARVFRRDRVAQAAAVRPDGASSSPVGGSSAPATDGGLPPFPSLPPGAAQVEELTAEGATLIPADGSREVMVYRWQLPPDVKEGDVVVDGRVDERATELLRQWIRDALAEIEKHGHPIPLPLPTLTGR